MTSAAAGKWIGDQLASSADQLVRSTGMDFLLGESYTAPWDIDEALSAYADAIDAVGRDSLRFMVALVVPLTPVGDLAPSPPDLARLDVHDVEPPSLYLFDRRFFAARFNDFEEYRTPLTMAVVPVERGQVHAYYSCYRDPRAHSSNWAYSRAIWYQHFHSD